MIKRFFRLPLAIHIILAVGLGILTGFIFGERISFLGEIGLSVVKLLKALATPLVFFAVIDALVSTDISLRSGLRLLQISLINATVAALICIGLSRVLPAERFVNIDSLANAIAVDSLPVDPKLVAHLSLKSFLDGLIPSNIFEPFVGNNIIAVVLLALLFGTALRLMSKSKALEAEAATLRKFVSGMLKLVMTVLGWIVHIVPIAAFTVVAKVVGTSGFQFFSALGVFVGIVSLGMAIHVLIYYSLVLKFVAKKSPPAFFREGSSAFLTSMSTGSSLATLPVTLPTLQEKMKVTPASSRLAACVGTNLNHTGILLYEASAALFIAQIQSIHLSFTQELGIAVTSAIAAFGIAGIPDAGLISLSVVLGAVGLPLTAVPFLLPVDWLLGRLRATVNVASDMTVAHLLDRLP